MVLRLFTLMITFLLQHHQLKARAVHQCVGPTANVVKLTTKRCALVCLRIWEYRRPADQNVSLTQSVRKIKLVWNKNVWTLASERVACEPRVKWSITIRSVRVLQRIPAIRLWSAVLFQVNTINILSSLILNKKGNIYNEINHVYAMF